MLLFGAASCQDKNSDIEPELEGTTYMSLVLDLSQSIDELRSTRAGDDDVHNSVGNWGGRDKIENVDVYIVHPSRIQYFTVSIDETKTQNPTSTQDAIYITKPWVVQPGTGRYIYVVINNGGAIKDSLNAVVNATVGDRTIAFEKAYNKAYDYTLADYAKVKDTPPKDVILMSGEPLAGVSMQAGITEEQATISNINDINPNKNQFALTVRRSAARVAVTKGTALHPSVNITDANANVYGTLTNLQWTYGQFEKKTHVLWDATATVSPISTKLHFTTKSPSWGYIPTVADYDTEALDNYDYTFVNNAVHLDEISVLTDDNASVANIIKDGKMKFLTETTHQYGDEQATGYRKGNTPYVMIEAVFTPEDAFWATDQKDAYTPGNDLFYNKTNGKFYATLSAAQADAPGTHVEDGVIKYTNAKAYYFAWLNPDGVELGQFKPDKVFNSPVIRNNIYHINITGFSRLGFSGNPFNPDPDNPFPVDPDDDVPAPDELLKTEETYMSAQVTVVNWGVHSYNVGF